ncbi:MAG TPA: SH3 domain-containing protein [Thermoanaerobaculia bacterium]|nr:SH3 domain-containing protein [Thermoanaerobaculia bacterium]HUM29994.1 SH3 domain-containing protein [Thermoanaerobaculia bacterium]HXK68317.1 SH3 domain-containing protein [Thermoanaerobaculia bacterium]
MNPEVIRAHPGPEEPPLHFREGEEVLVSEASPIWPGWVRCTGLSGREAWVPERWMKIRGNTGILLRDYDSTELKVSPGDRLILLERESGWALCKTDSGEKGWVPEDIFQPQ